MQFAQSTEKTIRKILRIRKLAIHKYMWTSQVVYSKGGMNKREGQTYTVSECEWKNTINFFFFFC